MIMPKGLPNTIYEALAARTPLIISDHPAFASRLQDGENCLSFRAADAEALADSLQRLIGDPSLYEKLSSRSAAAHDSLYFGMQWADLVSVFLRDPYNKTGWVEENSLAKLMAARPEAAKNQ